MKDTRKNLSLLAIAILALIAGGEAAVLLGAYFFNWMVYMHSIMSMGGCWMMGGWGLFWDDDDGLMIADCLNLFSGSQVTFPVEYAE